MSTLKALLRALVCVLLFIGYFIWLNAFVYLLWNASMVTLITYVAITIFVTTFLVLKFDV